MCFRFLAAYSFTLLEKPNCRINGEHRYVGVVLYKHPSNGLLMDLSQWQSLILETSLRRIEGVLSSADVLLKPFNLPFLLPDETVVQQGESALVIFSVNGRPMNEFNHFDECIDSIRSFGMFCHFRFLYVPHESLGRIPRDFSMDLPALPPLVSEYRSLRRGLIMREGDLDELESA